MVGVIVVSSIAAPFTLPTIAYFLFKEKISIPLFDMIFLLAMALLIPLFVGWYTRKKADRLAKLLMKIHYRFLTYFNSVNQLVSVCKFFKLFLYEFPICN